MPLRHELLNAALDHHRAGRYGEAERGYRHLLAVHPEDADARHLLGLVAAAAGQIPEAVERVRRALALSPAFPDALFNTGNHLRRLGRMEEALAALRRAAILDPNPRNREAAGTALIEAVTAKAGGLRHLNAAFQAIHRHNRAQPLWRSGALAGLGPEGLARLLADTREALALAPRNGTVAYLAALVFVAADDLESALATLERPTDDQNPDLARLGAEVAWYLRRAEAARALYHEFIRRKCAGDVPARPLLAEVGEELRRRPRRAAEGPVLIYTHYGNPDYLHHSIGQSLISNPGARVVLIGDRENRIEGVDHHLIQDYVASSREVVGLYRHDSDNAYCYELFCIARWFVFLDLCRAKGFEEMFFLDSDYMLFTDLESELPSLRETGTAFSHNSAHFSYFTFERLEALCEHIRTVFHGGEDTGAFHSRNNSDLFSDMAFIYDFQRAHPHRDLCEIREGTFFDYSVTAPDGFRTSNGVKDIWFEDGRPYGFHEESGRPVRFHGLHFQGLSKPLMKEAFFRRPWGRSTAGAEARHG